MDTSFLTNYRTRLGFDGNSQSRNLKGQSITIKEASFTDSPSYKEVLVDGKFYDARILQDVSATVKTGLGNYQIEFREGVVFRAGTYVEIKNIFDEYETWMIMEVSDDVMFPLHPIKKCTKQIRWKNTKGEVIERWLAFDDSYKLYDGIRTYDNTTSIPEGTRTILLPLDSETIHLKLDKRFLLDAPGITEEPEAWKVVNRNAISRARGDYGIVMLALEQDQFNHQTDNAELMVADYYTEDIPVEEESSLSQDITPDFVYKGQLKITAGSPAKTFELQFLDKNGNKVDITPHYEVMILPELQEFFKVEEKNNKVYVKATYNENVINYKFKIKGSNDDGTLSKEILVKVVSGI